MNATVFVPVTTVFHELEGDLLLESLQKFKRGVCPGRVHIYTEGSVPQHFTSVQIRKQTIHCRDGMVSFIGVPWSGTTACNPILFFYSKNLTEVLDEKEHEIRRIARIKWS